MPCAVSHPWSSNALTKEVEMRKFVGLLGLASLVLAVPAEAQLAVQGSGITVNYTNNRNCSISVSSVSTANDGTQLAIEFNNASEAARASFDLRVTLTGTNYSRVVTSPTGWVVGTGGGRIAITGISPPVAPSVANLRAIVTFVNCEPTGSGGSGGHGGSGGGGSRPRGM
jgi:hypothetical protein